MRFLQGLWILAFVVSAVSYPAGLVIVQMAGVRAQMIFEFSVSESIKDEAQRQKKREEAIAVNRGMFDADKNAPTYSREVMELYGQPSNEEAVFLFVPRDRFFHPEELPSLTLLRVDKDKKEMPVEGAPFLFFAQWISHGCAIGGVVLMILWAWLRRRAAAKAAAAQA